MPFRQKELIDREGDEAKRGGGGDKVNVLGKLILETL